MPEPVVPSSTGRAIVAAALTVNALRPIHARISPQTDDRPQLRMLLTRRYIQLLVTIVVLGGRHAAPDAAAAELDDLVRDQYSIAARVEELHRQRDAKGD